MDDRISKLPEPILHRILNFHTTKSAVRTSVLSKSWRHIWSTHPIFCLNERDFGEDTYDFQRVLDTTFRGYHDRNICIEEFKLWLQTLDTVFILRYWLPKVVQNMRVKKFSLILVHFGGSYLYRNFERECIDLLQMVVFRSEHLQHLSLRKCILGDSIEDRLHVKNLQRLYLEEVHIMDHNLEKILLSCPLLERIFLIECKELRNIRLTNKAHLKAFHFTWFDEQYGNSSIEFYDVPTIEEISIVDCQKWSHHRNRFYHLKSLSLKKVELSTNWLDSFSSNFPCVELFHMNDCYGFTRFQLSSASIKKLEIIIPVKAEEEVYPEEAAIAIDAPNIADFHYAGFIPLSLSFTATPAEWSSHMDFHIIKGDRAWLRKLHEVLQEASQSKIYLKINSKHDVYPCGSISSFYKPLVLEQLSLTLGGHSSSLLSEFILGLFNSLRPRKIGNCYYHVDPIWEHHIKSNQLIEILCKILLLEDGEMGCYWKRHLEEVILEASYPEEGAWRCVQPTPRGWLEACDALMLLNKCKQRELRFRLRWRDLSMYA